MSDAYPHFPDEDFSCHCGCGYDAPDNDLRAALEELRGGSIINNRPIIVTCGCRCAKHNADVGGAPDSRHVTGEAADIRVAGLDMTDLYRAAVEVPAFNLGGIGIYPGRGFIHVDTRDNRARWAQVNGSYRPFSEGWAVLIQGEVA